jgi:putative DNA primase/helicase
VIGADLFDKGYDRLVLIHNQSKAPFQKDWLTKPPTRLQAEQWEYNLGLIADNFPAVDIDLHDEKIAREIAGLAIKHFGPAPLRRSHRPASLLLPYRTDIPFKKKVLTLPGDLGKVEILGEGRQYLVHGYHPEGTQYAWVNRHLAEIPAKKLTLVNEPEVDAFLATLQQKYGGVIGRASAAQNPVDKAELVAPSLEAVIDILDVMPNNDAFLARVLPGMGGPRDLWVAIGMAVKGACGDEGLQPFLDWTLKYEDGPVDLDKARIAYEGFRPDRFGYPTLDRIWRESLGPSAEEEFTFEEMPPEKAMLVSLRPYAVEFSDEYMADRLAPVLINKLRFTGSWLLWDRDRWVVDDTKDSILAEGPLRNEMRIWAERIEAMSALAPSKDEAAKLRARAKSLMTRTTMRTILEHLKLPLYASMETFNVDPLAVNTPNGIHDLASGTQRPTTPADRITHITTVAPTAVYDPRAAPNWEAFLDHLTGGDIDLRLFLRRYAGYCLTGRMDEKKFVFAWGSRSNTGKSTFINAVAHVMGTYAHTDDVKLVMGGMPAGRKEQGLARLFGARLFHATEPSSGSKWDDEIIKKITGNDPVTARLLYKEPFDYRPQFKIMIGGNHEPELQHLDKPFLQRILIVPMDNPVPASMMDRLLGEKLEAEGPSILRWMMDGAHDWLQQGLNPPAAVQAATKDYHDAEDIYEQWVQECCDLDPSFPLCSSSDLYRVWKSWCGSRGRAPGSAVGFGRAISGHCDDWQIERARTTTDRGFKGIRLKPKVALGTDDFDIEEADLG